MKFIFALICTLFLSISAYAAPVFYQYGDNNDLIVYLGETKFYNLYATQKSLDFLDNFSTYRDTKIWVLDVFYEPKDNLKPKCIEFLKESDVTWLNTVSGSRKFWAIKTTMSYEPRIPFLNMNTKEDIINDNGEILGIKNCEQDVEANEIDFNKPNSYTQIVTVINSYLEKHYPPKRQNTPVVE